jgi:hypothetical protein
MLEKVRHAWRTVGVLGCSDFIPKLLGDDRHAMVGHDHDLHAVAEHEVGCWRRRLGLRCSNDDEGQQGRQRQQALAATAWMSAGATN